MTISFQLSLADYWHQISYLATKTIAGRCILAVYLLLPFMAPSVALYYSLPGSKAEHIAALIFWPVVGATYLILAAALTLGLLLGAAIAPKSTVTIDREFCCTKILFTTKSPWRRFSRCAEEPDFLYFVGWRGHAYIPKLAFDSRTEADAFYQTALRYWREAKGLPEPSVPDTTGVWPPAPRPGNSAEPESGRQG